MGTWRLEVLKMFIYVSFPVGMFHIFNNPRYFEKWVIDTKRRELPPNAEEHSQALRELKEFFRKKREAEIDRELARF